MHQKFSQNVDGYCFIYAVDDLSSFEEVICLKEKLAELNNQKDLPCILIGNKLDNVNQNLRQNSV